VRGGHGCPRHRIDLRIDAGFIRVDLEEHVAYAQGRPLFVRHDDLDLLHRTIIC
jgi:hypothetical protein